MSRRNKPCRCGRCSAQFYDGDDAYTWMEGNANEILVCEDCFDELVDALSRTELAELLGSRVLTVDDFCISAGAYYG